MARAIFQTLLTIFLTASLSSCVKRKYTVSDVLIDGGNKIVLLKDKPSECKYTKNFSDYFRYNAKKSKISKEDIAISLLKKYAVKKKAKAVRLKEIVHMVRSNGPNEYFVSGFIYNCKK